VKAFVAARWQLSTRNVFARAMRRAALERRTRADCSRLLHTLPFWSAVRVSALVRCVHHRSGLPICARSRPDALCASPLRITVRDTALDS
jgi:hypothetical protein